MAKLDKLITYAYLKDECDMPENLPDKEVSHLIHRAQETLRMLMGDEFYQAFILEYKVGTPFTTVVYQSLFDPYVKQYVAWQTHEFWVPKANFKKTRAGFRVHTEENSTAATDIQMAILTKDAKYQAAYYKQLLLDYLNNHYADYPLYPYSCNKKVTGNAFHISAVKNKHKCEHKYKCRCHD